MALPDQLSPEALAKRHIQLRDELRSIEQRFARQQETERANLESRRAAVEEESERERQTILSSLGSRLSVSNVIEDVISSKKALALKELEEDFQKREAQLKESFDQARQQHVLKWRNAFNPADLGVPPPPQPSLDRRPPQQPYAAAQPAMTLLEHHRSSLPQQHQAQHSAQHPAQHQVDGATTRTPLPTQPYPLGPTPPPQQAHQQHHNQETRYVPPYAPPSQHPPLAPGPRMPHSHAVPVVPSQPLPAADRPTHHHQAFPILPSQPLPNTQQRTPLPYGPQGMRPPPSTMHSHSSHLPPSQQTTGLRAPEAAARYSGPAMPQHAGMETRDRSTAPPEKNIMAYPQARHPPPPVEAPPPPEPVVSKPVEVKWKAVNQGVPNHRPATPQGRREPLTALGGQDINQLGSDQQKRKAEDSSAAETESAPKRTRSDADAASGAADQASSPRSKQAEEKTITFDEVFQNGNAKHKHIIVEYPPHTGKYYILKCEEHGVHFNMNPLAGAAKHLHSAQHGNMTKERAQAVELLGYRIQDCDAKLAEKNNEVVKKAFEGGYKPFNLNQLSKTARTSMGYGEASPSGNQKTGSRSSANDAPNVNRRSSAGITDPVDGELYLVFWPKDKQQYPAIMLPWGDLKCAGLKGTLAATGLLQSVPKCYIVDPAHQEIKSWAPGYEDGGPLVAKREFPCYYFDADRSVGWVRAKDLSNFDFHTRDWKGIPGFLDAANHYARKSGYPDVTAMLGSGSFPAGRSPVTAPGNSVPPQIVAPTAPNEDYEMRDANGAPGDDSDRESDVPSRMDSDVEMANTESRRTSISNRPDATEAQADKTTPLDESKTTGENSEPVNATSAQLIAARALGIPAVTGGSQDETQQAGAKQASRQSSTSSSDQGRRRVEKIYASSNRNRASNSPRLSPTDRPRVPSPASLQNILQSNQADSREHPRHRPGPLHQQSFLSEQHARQSPSPMNPEHQPPNPLPAPTPQVQSSTTQLEGLSISDKSSGTEPPSRTSTPVIVTSVEAADRWRAIRAEPAKAQPLSKHLDSPRILSPLTPNPSVSGGTNPNSPTKFQSPGPGVKPEQQGDAEVFDVALLPEGNGEVFDVAKKGPIFQLTVDTKTMSAYSAVDAPTRLIINPTDVKQAIVEKTTSDTALAVRLVFHDNRNERVLIFETSDTGKGPQPAAVRMRRFCRWLTKSNPNTEYINRSTSTSRSASFTTA